MKTVAIENACLPDLLVQLRAADEILLTQHAEPVAKLVSLAPAPSAPGAAALQERRQAVAALKASGGLRDVIADPAEWQRNIRQDTPLPSID
jgi:antitoxin (DNA-binding transcriptional repressor) of toxin-antitoxin stability system